MRCGLRREWREGDWPRGIRSSKPGSGHRAGIDLQHALERIRQAALTQNDDKLQCPFISNLADEVWKTKEAKLPTDEKMGDAKARGILMEAITATCMLMAGGETLIMRHPKAIALTKSLINGLMG